MSDKNKICLVGFMGAGKTSVAANLARLLSAQCIDLDAQIEESEHSLIAQIIERDGETKFRQIETQILRRVLTTRANFVLALGGGAWTIVQNRALLIENGCLAIWLDAPFELCWQRIAAAQTVRPLAPDEQRARRVFDERLAVYRTAEMRIAIGAEQTPQQIAQRIFERIRG